MTHVGGCIGRTKPLAAPNTLIPHILQNPWLTDVYSVERSDKPDNYTRYTQKPWNSSLRSGSSQPVVVLRTFEWEISPLVFFSLLIISIYSCLAGPSTSAQVEDTRIRAIRNSSSATHDPCDLETRIRNPRYIRFLDYSPFYFTCRSSRWRPAVNNYGLTSPRHLHLHLTPPRLPKPHPQQPRPSSAIMPST